MRKLVQSKGLILDETLQANKENAGKVYNVCTADPDETLFWSPEDNQVYHGGVVTPLHRGPSAAISQANRFRYFLICI